MAIPPEDWPEPFITNELIVQTGEAREELERGHDYTDNDCAMAKRLYTMTHDRSQTNHLGETPDQLMAKIVLTLNEFEHADGSLQKVHHTIAAINTITDAAQEKFSAGDFIAFANDPAIQKAVPWLQNYKPDEEEFLDTFDPDWRDRKSNTDSTSGRDYAFLFRYQDPIDESVDEDIEPELVKCVRLHRMGFYDWQKERKSRELEAYLQHKAEQAKKAREDELNEQLEMLRTRRRDKDRDMDIDYDYDYPEPGMG